MSTDNINEELGPSSDAIHEFLRRLRQQLISEGHVVPPQVALGGHRAADNDTDVQGVACSSGDRYVAPPSCDL